MRVALGQFAVSPSWEDNLALCLAQIAEAKAGGARLVVLPEGILARDPSDPDHVLRTAQPLDGPFVSGLLPASEGIMLVFCVNVPDGAGRFHNTLVVMHDGLCVALYQKLHLYDAFAMQESRLIAPGHELPPVLTLDGMKIGFMTCYDVRFPEMARYLALAGADIIVVPAAWLRGPAKERHWEIMLAARALENTCFVLGAGECGPQNIGNSMIIDPLGVVIAARGATPGLVFETLDPASLQKARQTLPVLQNRRFAAPVLSPSSGKT
ncbi:MULTISPECIES: deaminated glutathione amidase [Asaia]|uniref:Deaminated glutathione amidase n=1 Tax=Asaia spathodeae TaxID=657016 RepID=A0ABX2P1S1_9PROT|nr:deaminated glutathione amidase [Asaia spathodeae]GBR14909.1 hydrolase [Asaia spathodeae NBRC 105894]